MDETFYYIKVKSDNPRFDLLTGNINARWLNAHSIIYLWKEVLCVTNHIEETDEHYMFYCTQFTDLREGLLSSQPNTQNTINCRHRQSAKTHVIFRWIAKKKNI